MLPFGRSENAIHPVRKTLKYGVLGVIGSRHILSFRYENVLVETEQNYCKLLDTAEHSLL